jgi:hypothetical protein
MTIIPSVIPSVALSANPSGPIVSGTSVEFSANLLNGGSNPIYTWYKNGVVVGTDSTYIDNNLIYGDTIWLLIASNEPCALPNQAISDSLVIDVITRTFNMSLSENLKVYPNPNNGSFILDVKQKSELIITDAVGKIIYTIQLKSGSNNIDLSSQAHGIYFVKLISENEQSVIKMLINN